MQVIKYIKLFIRITCLSRNNFIYFGFLFFGFCTPKDSKTEIFIQVPHKYGFAPVLYFLKHQNLEKDKIVIVSTEQKKIPKGEYFIRGGDFAESILQILEGEKNRIVYRLSNSVDGEIFVCKKDIDIVKEIKDKKIGILGINTSSHLFVEKILSQKWELTELDYQILVDKEDQIIEKIQSGELIAGHVSYKTPNELASFHLKAVANSNDLLDFFTNVLFTNEKFIKEKPEVLRTILLEIIKTTKEFSTNREKAIQFIKEEWNVSEPEAVSIYQGILFYSEKTNQQSFNYHNEKVINTETNPYLENRDVKKVQTSMNFSIGDQSKKPSLLKAGEFIINFYKSRGQLNQLPAIQDLVFYPLSNSNL